MARVAPDANERSPIDAGIVGFIGPQLGARLAVKNTRAFTEQQMIEARAMPARWTNVGKAGVLPAAGARKPW